MHPDTSYTPWWPNVPLASNPLGAPNASWCPYTPAGPWTPTLSANPPINSWHPYAPWWPQNALHLLPSPNDPLMPWYPCWSLCNWSSSWVRPVNNIPSWGVKSTSAVFWSSANFCNIFQNMHSKAPVALQCRKTNKVVWTWKDDRPPWRTSTYERPFTWEGNYLVLSVPWWLMWSWTNMNILYSSLKGSLIWYYSTSFCIVNQWSPFFFNKKWKKTEIESF